MSNVVFCADGTWNGPGRDDGGDKDAPPTNVFKLFLNLEGVDDPASLRLANEQERFLRDAGAGVIQAAKYIHGVGDSDNFLVRMLGGGLGAGIITRIVRGYTFLSRNYTPGDDIFIVGFSRGAYTARALAGLVATKGLLDRTQLDLSDKENAYRLGAAVWFDYRRITLSQLDGDWFGELEEVVADLPRFVSAPPTPCLVADVLIKAVAVWDTVGALGIPVYTDHETCVDAFRFADTRLSPKAAHGFHAVSLDEQRADFTPTLWDPDPRILQVLFPGAHADVGGGYPTTNHESDLSDGAFDWLLGRLDEVGVRIQPARTAPYAPSALGTAHQPWLLPPWRGLPYGARDFSAASTLLVDPSVCERLKAPGVRADPTLTPMPYAPPNLGPFRNQCP